MGLKNPRRSILDAGSVPSQGFPLVRALGAVAWNGWIPVELGMG